MIPYICGCTPSVHDQNSTTMEPLNNGHIGGKGCRGKVVLFWRLENTTTISLVARNVSIVEKLSLFSEGPFIRGSTV